MKLEIFDVGHGACALLSTDNYRHIMIDCGHNADTGWLPGNLLRSRSIGLDMLAITNFDEDHASGANNLFDQVNVDWMYSNRSVPPAIITKLKTKDGMGPGIERVAREISTRTGTTVTGSVEPTYQGVEIQTFRCEYPMFDDENNLSMAMFLKLNGVGVMFPGDLEKPAFIHLLKDPRFRIALCETNLYIASHHGRESGCCEELLPFLTEVQQVVISDKFLAHETQVTNSFYRRIANGKPFRGNQRFVLTTRSDKTITYDFNYAGWSAS